jgi:L-lactate permease
MNNFLNFFFGTPRRLTACLVVLLIIAMLFNMDAVEDMLHRVYTMLVTQVLPIAIVILIIVLIVKKAMNPKK